MIGRDHIKPVFSPPAEPSKRDTGLRFTDVLFGFVIRELFIRLQHWSELDGYVQCQLIAATVLVLGSWIGFRRSLNRTDYELKFFNIPLLRFLLDQAMVVLYFRIATLTPQDPQDPDATPLPPADQLAHTTAKVLLFVAVLYVAWDLLGMVMGRLDKYPDNTIDRAGVVISVVWLAGAAGVYFLLSFGDFGDGRAKLIFILSAVLLAAYRFAKEIKSSWKGSGKQTAEATATAAAPVVTASARGKGATVTASGDEATAHAAKDG